MMKMIDIKPYDPDWPHIFEKEAVLIRQALGDNCLATHHIGSTAVEGLAAKPKIDILAVLPRGDLSIVPLEKEGFSYKGRWNIPFKFGFTKRGQNKINLHVFEENDPEIDLHLLFRDHLQGNPSARDAYALPKYKLIAGESSHSKNDSIYRVYTLGKYDFIQNILKKSCFNKYRFVLCTHTTEWLPRNISVILISLALMA